MTPSEKNIICIADRITIKPLSVNDAWQGRRFKTPEYKAYEQELSYKLKHVDVDWGKTPLRLLIIFGVSNAASDYDNPLKPTQDILAKKYGFNDRHIWEAVIRKRLVPKGHEYIEFTLSKMEPEFFSLPETHLL